MALPWPGPGPAGRSRAGDVLARLAVEVTVQEEWNDRTLGLVGESRAMEDLRTAIRGVADSPYAVLIMGESGTGKELVARAVHQLSRRPLRRFGAVNCAALTDDLFEAELFGCVRGAYTGAVTDRAGLFEATDRGSLLLDEVGELSTRAQAKLLRALQEGEIRRVGETQPRRVDVRVIGATNRPLDTEVQRGRFREDLLYRLDVLRLHVPAVRERQDDARVLVEHFWNRARQATGRSNAPSRALLTALERYHWPGNVRQVQNVVASLVVRGPRTGVVSPDALPSALGPVTDAPQTLSQARTCFERQYVSGALVRAGGRRGQAASALGLSRQGLSKLLKRLDLDERASSISRTSG